VNNPSYYIDGLLTQGNAALARAYLGISGGGGIPEAPVDGQLYGRDNATWVVVPPPGISDAPIDGNQYARQNAAWSVVSATPPTGNLTELTSAILTITGGTGAVVGAGTTIQVQKSDATHNGYLSSTDWSTFNGKQPAGSYLTDAPSDGFTYGRNNAAWVLTGAGADVLQVQVFS
jgi:hypothetical protein